MDSPAYRTDARGPVIDRPRLLSLLRRPARGSGSGLIWGPAGSGKSLLLNAHVMSVAPYAPAGIVVLAPRHNDRKAFWGAVETALANASGIAPEPATADAEDVIARWGNLDNPPLIAFDNADLVDNIALSTEIEPLHRDPSIELLISSRHLARTVPRRWMLRGDVATIGPADLAFTAEETEALYGAAGTPERERRTAELLERTLGWVGAVSLAVRLQARHDQDIDGALESFAQFLDEEILANLPPEALDALIQISLDPHLPAPLVSTLTADPTVATWLDQAVDDGLLVPRSAGNGAPQPHPCVAAAVERHLSLDPPRREQLYASVVRRSLELNEGVAALAIARRSGSAALIRDVIRDQWPRLLLEQIDGFRGALEALPPDFRRRDGLLVAFHAMAGTRTTSTPPSVQTVVDGAVAMISADDWMGAAATGFAAVILDTRAGRFDEALQRCDELLGVIGALAPADDPSANAASAMLAGTLGELYLTLGNLAAARGWLAEASDFARLADSAISVLTWQSLLSLVDVLEGRLDRAEAHLNQVAKIIEKRTWDPALESPTADIARAMIYMEADRFEEAMASLENARTKNIEVRERAFLAYAEALVHHQRGSGSFAVEAVEDLLDGMAGWEPPAFIRAVAASSRTAALYAAGRAEEAARIAARAEPDPTHTMCLATARAGVHLRQGDPAAALAELHDCLVMENHARRQLLFVLVLAAHADLQLGGSQAVAYFTRALAIANVSGLRRAFSQLRPAELADLLAAVRRANPPPDILDMCEELDLTVTGGIAAQANLTSLTPREREILVLLDTTQSLTELASHLHVSPNTLKTQTRSIYRKLGVSSRAAAIAVARTHGLL